VIASALTPAWTAADATARILRRSPLQVTMLFAGETEYLLLSKRTRQQQPVELVVALHPEPRREETLAHQSHLVLYHSAATGSIAGNVQQAAHGTTIISGTISGVTAATAETGAAAGQVLDAASELAHQAETRR
jgi:hypothetical protein